MAIMLSTTNGPDALKGEVQESEYPMSGEPAEEQYKIEKADYEAFGVEARTFPFIGAKLDLYRYSYQNVV